MRNTDQMGISGGCRIVDVSSYFPCYYSTEEAGFLLRKADGFETRKIRVENLTPSKPRTVTVRVLHETAVECVERILAGRRATEAQFERLCEMVSTIENGYGGA